MRDLGDVSLSWGGVCPQPISSAHTTGPRSLTVKPESEAGLATIVGSHTALVSKLWSSVPTGWQATTNEGDEDDWAPINSHYFTQTRRMQMRCGWPSQWCVPLDECSDGCVMYVVCAIHINRI